MTYQDYDWVGLLNDGTLSKQTGAVLDKYVQYHHSLKNERNIISNLTNSATQQKQFDSDKELVEATLSSGG